MTVGSRIKERRIAAGLSVNTIAELLGKDRATVYRYENGDIADIPVSIVSRIADILRTSPMYLIGWEDSPAPYDPSGDSSTDLEQDELELLNSYRILNEAGKSAALSMLHGLKYNPEFCEQVQERLA